MRHTTTTTTTTTRPARAADPHPAPPREPAESGALAPAVDVPACFAHLLAALDALARTAGSPPEVMRELAALRAVLGKES